MKKILALGLGLSLIMSLGTANASDVAQKGDTDIFFNHGNIRRNGRQFFEYQRVVNYKDKDISLLHMRVKGDDYVSAKLVHNLTGIEIPLEQLDIKTDYVLQEAKEKYGRTIGIMHSLPRFAGEFDFNIDKTEHELYFKQIGFSVPLRMALIAAMVGC